MPFPWFDAHLDLAYLAVNKRDMHAAHPPAGSSVTLPALAEAGSRTSGVRIALATIFTEPVFPIQPGMAPLALTPEQYPARDADAAHRAGRAQLEAYLTWRDQGHIALDLREHLRIDPGTGEIRGGMGVTEPIPPSPRKLIKRVVSPLQTDIASPLHVGILIENADVIRTPDELSWWKDRGVVAIGMSWATPSRYAGGNATPWGEQGLTPVGFELAREMDRLRIMHDLSHLSDRAADDLLATTRADRPLMASHSNSRSVLFGSATPGRGNIPSFPIGAQRHLSDHHATEIIRRRGVIGLNLYSRFLTPNSDNRPSLDAAIVHVEHWCELAAGIPGVANPRGHVALGSDMDGGFGVDRLPLGIDSPRDLDRLLDLLSRRGWTDDDLFNFACGNLTRAFSAAMS